MNNCVLLLATGLREVTAICAMVTLTAKPITMHIVRVNKSVMRKRSDTTPEQAWSAVLPPHAWQDQYQVMAEGDPQHRGYNGRSMLAI